MIRLVQAGHKQRSDADEGQPGAQIPVGSHIKHPPAGFERTMDIRQDRAVLATVVEHPVHVDHVELIAGQNVPIADVPDMELNTRDVGERPPGQPDGFVVDVETIDFPIP